jgi:transposase-like protein
MSKRHLSDYHVKKIIQHFVLDLTATQTSQLLGMSRLTINRYYSAFRLAIAIQREQDKRLLTGQVEVDESYFGAARPRGAPKKLKRGRGTLKQPVFGIFERDGQVYTEIVPDCKKATLQGIIRGKVSLETAIFSDSWRGYNGLVDVGYDRHLRVNHSKEYSRGRGCHINGIESFWSFTKRRLRKFNGVAKHTFVLHLKECEWRWQRDPKTLEKELFKLFKTFRANALQVSNSLNSDDDDVILR